MPARRLLAAARLADSGRDVGRFFGDLEAHLRGLMIVQTLGEVPDELAVTAEQDARLAEQAARVGEAAVLRLLDLVADALRAMKDGADPRTQLELALIKAARPEHDASLRALTARLERLEGRGTTPAPVHHPEVPATAAGRAAQDPAGATDRSGAPQPVSSPAGEAGPAIPPRRRPRLRPPARPARRLRLRPTATPRRPPTRRRSSRRRPRSTVARP